MRFLHVSSRVGSTYRGEHAKNALPVCVHLKSLPINSSHQPLPKAPTISLFSPKSLSFTRFLSQNPSFQKTQKSLFAKKPSLFSKTPKSLFYFQKSPKISFIFKNQSFYSFSTKTIRRFSRSAWEEFSNSGNSAEVVSTRVISKSLIM